MAEIHNTISDSTHWAYTYACGTWNWARNLHKAYQPFSCINSPLCPGTYILAVGHWKRYISPNHTVELFFFKCAIFSAVSQHTYPFNGVRCPRQTCGPKIRANVPPKGLCWRHRVCHLGAIVVAWAACGFLALVGYKRRKSALTVGPIALPVISLAGNWTADFKCIWRSRT